MNGIARGETYSPESVADEFLSIAKKSIKQGEMKTTWSEEDEEIFDELIAYFMDDVFLNHTEENIVAWLKSLRPQINVTDEELAQAKKEAYNDALDKIEYHSGEPTFDDGWSAAIWYLKKRNARPQNTWKPSEAQMERLKEACDEHYEVDGLDPLYTLYQDLQKLRED